jgi:hypothetical protein
MRHWGCALAGALFVTLLMVASGCVSSGPGSDFDRDGLPDDVEDRDENFAHDPGETDFNNPDTDGDGLCDGQPKKPLAACSGCEDCNNNGFWEPCLGETDPLNDDTDDDGIPDGEDPNPLGNLNWEALGVDCAQGNAQLPYGASLPPGKPFPGFEEPTPTP